MTEITGAEDVYQKLVQSADTNWLYGLVAFAIVEEQRIEWMKHVQEKGGAKPDHAAIATWYRQQPDGVLLRAKGTAENALKLYADDVLGQILDAERRDVADGEILSAVKSMNSFWPQFGKNVAAGFASSLIFAALLTILALIIFSDASPIAIGAGIKGQ